MAKTTLLVSTTLPFIVPVYVRRIQIPALVTGIVAQAPSAADYFTVGGLDWTTTGTKYAFFQWEIPDDWDGTDMLVEVIWFPASATKTAPAAVKWDIEYRAIAEGEAINNGTSVTLTSTDVATVTQYIKTHTPHTLTFNNANQPLTAQDHIFFKVSRDTGVAADWMGTVNVPAFEIIYNSISMPGN